MRLPVTPSRPRFTASEVTPEPLWLGRRELLAAAALVPAAALGRPSGVRAGHPGPAALPARRNLARSLGEPATRYEHATTYNNFYEFGVTKEEPERLSHGFRARPWELAVDGLVARPQTFGIDELLELAPLEERVYALRCVEAWSMVIPWIGYSLAELLARVEPTSAARFVELTTLHDTAQFPGQRPSFFGDALRWPYVEGLRLDEARHPLTILTLGMYGRALPNQNGAPVRVVVPWKYGFKSAKSIVRVRLTAARPRTSWEAAAPHEYGFYANVNPAVSHPRWSQTTERRIGEARRRPTLPFNGYGAEVAGLYGGMDLRRDF